MIPNEPVRFEQEVFFDTYQYGTTDGIPSGQIKIMRGSDGYFWDGAAFDVPDVWLNTTIDGLLHYYEFEFPSTNNAFYLITMRVNNDPATEDQGNYIVREAGGGGSTSGFLRINAQGQIQET